MSKLPWTPWHHVVQVRDDVRTGELSLAAFAADLYDVAMQTGRRPIYEDPQHFFALTYPTYNLRELARDVVLRLAGQNDKAIRQLELTYGGGKTHTLITLYHLVHTPAHLPDLPTVHEFRSHIGIMPPQARVAVISFDKLDVEKGMEVRAPNGATRWLIHPWSVLAFALAGPEGLRLLSADNSETERESAPAENLLTSLLTLPQRDGLATLILVDEVLMYAREKVGLDLTWRDRLVNFFQYLTQAVVRVDTCALVASLLATDPARSDALGKELIHELAAIFRREREEGVQPVVKEDVAEVLRRRFFTPESIRDREAFRPAVTAALQGIAALDDQTRKTRKEAEERFLKSYPFHPDLTDVFYTKWTNLEGFQRTRGVLRTFALAIRHAEPWDTAPLIATNVLLPAPDTADLAAAARELTTVAATEEYDGKRQEWSGILEGELARAREIQQEYGGLRHREVEQAVVVTLLHSQPIGQRALLRDLLVLLGATRPDRIDLGKALRRWAEVSWFLDETAMQESTDEADGLPKTWRLGSKPNLTQIFNEARRSITADLIEARLLFDINKLKRLTEGATAAGATVHTLPSTPDDIQDDGVFHYAVLGPRAVSDSGKPSSEARRFLDETTPGTPRTYRNAVVLAVPSRDGLELVRQRIRDYLGWEAVRSQLTDQDLDPLREQRLTTEREHTRKAIPDAIRQAYCIVVTVAEKNEVQAFKLTPSTEPLFAQIKADTRTRIRETPISTSALLPGGPYDLWREDEAARRVKDLVRAFAQFPHLPKMLHPRAILETLVAGVQAGTLVMRLTRPDQTVRTFWRTPPDPQTLLDAGMEVCLPEHASLTEVPAALLTLDTLPDLWSGPTLTVQRLFDYFGGETQVDIPQGPVSEPAFIPHSEHPVLEAAVAEAVREGLLWLVAGSSSIFQEALPPGILTAEAILRAPPAPIAATDVLPPNLPAAWTKTSTTARALAEALSAQVGQSLPWVTVQTALDGAFRARLLERTLDSAAWPCDYAGAAAIRVQVPRETPTTPAPAVPAPTAAIRESKPGIRTAETPLQPGEIQNLAEVVGDLVQAAASAGITFTLHIEVGNDQPVTDEIAAHINTLLQEVQAGLKVHEM